MKQLIAIDLFPSRAVIADTSAWNDEVDMRMLVLQVSTPGVQDSEKAGLFAAKVSPILHR